MSGTHPPGYYIANREMFRTAGAKWRAAHPEYMREYCKAWHARKKRQAKVIDRIVEQIARFESARRSAGISKEI